MTENEEIQQTPEMEEVKVEQTPVFQPEKRPFPLNTILNVVLFIAVGVLFFLHFSGGKGSVPETKKPVAIKGIGAIAFVDSDSLMEKYDYYKDTKTALDKFEEDLKNEYQTKTLSFKSEYENYLKIGASLSLAEQKRREEGLKAKQNSLIQLESELANKLAARKEEKNNELLDNIQSYIKKFNESKGYTLILAKSRISSGILFADESMDITNAVIEGLNNDYKEKKEKK